MVASRCFCYVRTDTEVPKHKGISVLIIDLDTPGVDIRPLRHISGRAEFAEVFFTDAVVPEKNLVGQLNDGWRITMGSLAHERGALWVEGVMASQRGVDDLITLARSRGATVTRSCVVASRSLPPRYAPCGHSGTKALPRSRRARRRRSTAS